MMHEGLRNLGKLSLEQKKEKARVYIEAEIAKAQSKLDVFKAIMGGNKTPAGPVNAVSAENTGTGIYKERIEIKPKEGERKGYDALREVEFDIRDMEKFIRELVWVLKRMENGEADLINHYFDKSLEN